MRSSRRHRRRRSDHDQPVARLRGFVSNSDYQKIDWLMFVSRFLSTACLVKMGIMRWQ